MKSLILIATMIYFTIGNIVMAKSPTIKPDWEKVTSYSIDLSGREIKYQLPSKLSVDFPQQVGNSYNIYDDDLFGDMLLFTVAKSYWDYKSRKLFFLDTIGTLSFRIAVFKTTNDFVGDVRNTPVLQEAIQNLLNKINMKFEETPIVEFSTKKIENNNWLYSVERKQPLNPDRFSYSLPLTENRYLEVSFNIMIGDDKDRDNWYETSKSDIEKIINSFSVTFPK